MKWMLVITFLVFCCFTLGQTLKCYSCTASISGYCVSNDRAEVYCGDSNQRCGTIKVSSRYYHAYTSFRCISSGCSQIFQIDPTTSVGVNITCCDTDMCNSGTVAAQLSLLPCAGILGVWLLSWA
ncbi:hypothetical protein NDU88_000870 [Pleurodeles waltl]|uniref:UPAR/Ly6 domain-containing protein n=1 Tax=Pleurodeles waltl TaxID=8319 RepID=A0AAV7Q6Y3_PLEWA|nr:hypothetical protein NDU88_000870 [Pleurodeles waltl]